VVWPSDSPADSPPTVTRLAVNLKLAPGPAGGPGTGTEIMMMTVAEAQGQVRRAHWQAMSLTQAPTADHDPSHESESLMIAAPAPRRPVPGD
jgi:hypothetical protein